MKLGIAVTLLPQFYQYVKYYHYIFLSSNLAYINRDLIYVE